MIDEVSVLFVTRENIAITPATINWPPLCLLLLAILCIFELMFFSIAFLKIEFLNLVGRPH